MRRRKKARFLCGESETIGLVLSPVQSCANLCEPENLYRSVDLGSLGGLPLNVLKSKQNTFLILVLLCVGLSAGLVAVAPPAKATESWFATVINAPKSDPLNARTKPSAKAPVARTFVNGNTVQLTANCINAVTKRRLPLLTTQLFVEDIQVRISAANMWCEIFNDKANLWVRGRYLDLSEEG